jgi:hypothetical protein
MKNALFFLLISGMVSAQKPHSKSFMNLSVGHTFMGTGDIRGYNLGFGFQKQFQKHFALETTFRATTASRAYQFGPYSNVNPSDFISNDELRFTTSGLQLEVLPVFPIINRHIKFSILAGPILRRQINNTPNIFGNNFIDNEYYLSVYYSKPPISYSLGGSVQLEAVVKFHKKNYLGARLANHFYVGDLNWYIPLVYQRQL